MATIHTDNMNAREILKNRLEEIQFKKIDEIENTSLYKFLAKYIEILNPKNPDLEGENIYDLLVIAFSDMADSGWFAK